MGQIFQCLCPKVQFLLMRKDQNGILEDGHKLKQKQVGTSIAQDMRLFQEIEIQSQIPDNKEIRGQICKNELVPEVFLSLKLQLSLLQRALDPPQQQVQFQKPCTLEFCGISLKCSPDKKKKFSLRDLQKYDNNYIELNKALLEQNQDHYYQSDDSQELYKPLKQRPKAAQIQWQGSEIIGQGSFGKVIFGMNVKTGQQIAVKQVELKGIKGIDPRVRALQGEIDLLSKLKNKNIVTYYGMERTETNINIFLEYIGGGSIAQLLKRFGILHEAVIQVYTTQILNGLHYLHCNGVMHRDIKGANILVDRSGACKLADFGSGKSFQGLILQDNYGSLCGTPNWMAPEVMEQDKYGRKADIWSVGCTIIEMATAQPPWGVFSNPFIALYQIAQKKCSPPIPDYLSDSAKDFLSKCLQPDPKNRWTAKRLLSHIWLQTPRSRVNSSQSIGSKPVSRASSVRKVSITLQVTKDAKKNIIIQQETNFAGNYTTRERISETKFDLDQVNLDEMNNLSELTSVLKINSNNKKYQSKSCKTTLQQQEYLYTLYLITSNSIENKIERKYNKMDIFQNQKKEIFNQQKIKFELIANKHPSEKTRTFQAISLDEKEQFNPFLITQELTQQINIQMSNEFLLMKDQNLDVKQLLNLNEYTSKVDNNHYKLQKLESDHLIQLQKDNNLRINLSLIVEESLLKCIPSSLVEFNFYQFQSEDKQQL